ncbi:MAG TPA: lipoprotein [Burkholderiaceae bacterium]|nr:lipoprotein [Burkholderiaceae bacterium]
MPPAGAARGAPFTLLRSLALLAACGAVAACGQKGPLTMPKSAAAASAPAR